MREILDSGIDPPLDGWVEEGLLSENDLEEISRYFLATARQHINVIPGYKISKTWSLEEVINLEEQGDELLDSFIASYDEALDTWGEAMKE